MLKPIYFRSQFLLSVFKVCFPHYFTFSGTSSDLRFLSRKCLFIFFFFSYNIPNLGVGGWKLLYISHALSILCFFILTYSTISLFSVSPYILKFKVSFLGDPKVGILVTDSHLRIIPTLKLSFSPKTHFQLHVRSKTQSGRRLGLNRLLGEPCWANSLFSWDESFS